MTYRAWAILLEALGQGHLEGVETPALLQQAAEGLFAETAGPSKDFDPFPTPVLSAPGRKQLEERWRHEPSLRAAIRAASLLGEKRCNRTVCAQMMWELSQTPAWRFGPALIPAIASVRWDGDAVHAKQQKQAAPSRTASRPAPSIPTLPGFGE